VGYCTRPSQGGRRAFSAFALIDFFMLIDVLVARPNLSFRHRQAAREARWRGRTHGGREGPSLTLAALADPPLA